MTLSDDEHFALINSYGRCCQSADFFDDFYERLLAADARIAPMFAHTDMAQQKRLLQQAIGALIQFAVGNTFGHEQVAHLTEVHARRHQNATPDLYPIWIHALIETIAANDSDWNAELEASWRGMLALGTDVMIAGYRD